MLVYALAGTAALSFWLGDPALARSVEQPLTWLLVGATLNTVYNVGYTNWVSLGQTRWILWVNLLSLSVTIAVLPAAIYAWGLVGAASASVIVNVIGASFTVVWLANSFREEKSLNT